jgi:hypothetical protein
MAFGVISFYGDSTELLGLHVSGDFVVLFEGGHQVVDVLAVTVLDQEVINYQGKVDWLWDGLHQFFQCDLVSKDKPSTDACGELLQWTVRIVAWG